MARTFRCLRAMAAGFLAGWTAGCLESAVIVATSSLLYSNPFLEQVELCLVYSIWGAGLGVALGLFLPNRWLSTWGGMLGTTTACFLYFLLIVWIHEVILSGSPPWAPQGILASLLALGFCLALGLGLRRIARQRPGMATGIVLLFAGIGHAGVVLLAQDQASSEPSIPAPAVRGQGPNILLIVVDTLRADHLGCYGYRPSPSPDLDLLADGSALFESAYAQASWTKPSVASLMTSLYPASHRANDLSARLGDDVTTLAESLRLAGYQTSAYSANRNVSPTFGFHQGFDRFWVHRQHQSRIIRQSSGERLRKVLASSFHALRRADRLAGTDAAAINRQLAKWADQVDSNRPWFLYVQYIDPHAPYLPPSEFLQELGISFSFEEVLRDEAFFPKPGPFPFVRWPAPKDGTRDKLIQLYDAEIQYCDRHIGALLADLRSQGLLENTFVVVTSDHGEEFFEHGQLGHGQSLFEELIRVPLLISGPGILPRRVQQSVELIDLYPTLVRLAGAALPEEAQGRDLAPLLAGEPGGASVTFSQILKDNRQDAVRIGTEKLIRVTYRGQSRDMLFDLSEDPGEQADLRDDHSLRLPEIQALLEAAREKAAQHGDRAVQQAEIDEETAEILRALGYTGR